MFKSNRRKPLICRNFSGSAAVAKIKYGSGRKAASFPFATASLFCGQNAGSESASMGLQLNTDKRGLGASFGPKPHCFFARCFVTLSDAPLSEIICRILDGNIFKSINKFPLNMYKIHFWGKTSCFSAVFAEM